MAIEAEIFDYMQRLYGEIGFNDHQMHCLVGLDAALDEAALRRAVEICLEAMPILATRFSTEGGALEWASLGAGELGRAFATADYETGLEAERTRRIDEEAGPQVRICLLSGKRSALAVTMNHMVADAAGFKAFLYALCGVYSRLLRGEAGATTRVEGSRGLEDLLASFGAAAKLGALLGRGGRSNKRGKFSFPLEAEEGTIPLVLTRTMPKERVAGLKAYCRSRGATINDAALAAYYRALARRLGAPALRGLEIPIMVDMRRYLRSKEFITLRNLTSTVITRVVQAEGESFERTLVKTKAQMDFLKRRNMGLGGIALISMPFSRLGWEEGLRLLRRSLVAPLLCMTNVGELDSSRLAFEGVKVESAYLCGSIKRKPHFQLALSGFDGELTLSSNIYGTRGDGARIEAFLAEVDGELSAAGD